MKTKKEIKEAYKKLKFRMGVFQIRNTVTGKIFVEGSTDLTAIWNRYRFALNLGGHTNEELQRDWKELGEDKFLFEILEEIEQKETGTVDYAKEVRVLEGLYLEEMQPFDEKGYNRRPKVFKYGT
jgi:hypothetical protein